MLYLYVFIRILVAIETFHSTLSKHFPCPHLMKKKTSSYIINLDPIMFSRYIFLK